MIILKESDNLFRVCYYLNNYFSSHFYFFEDKYTYIYIYIRMYYNMVIEGVHLQLFVPLYYWRQLIIIMKIDLIVFLLLLDASKTFGRIEYVKLFQTLRDRKICPTVLRLIMHMYVNQKILIRWNQ